MKFDLHVHTTASADSLLTPGELLREAKRAGIDGVAVTNHNVFQKIESDDLYIIPACEISSDAGHLLTYFLKSDICKKMKNNEKGVYDWREVVELAHNDGALVFAAHPYSPEVSRTEEFWEKIDGVEAFNARIVHSRNKAPNKRAQELCREKSLPFSAGSDAHSKEELGKAYFECSLSKNEINSPGFEERLKRELLAGRGKAYGGYSSAHTVLKVKRKSYIKRNLPKRYLKSIVLEIYLFVKSFLFGKEKQEYVMGREK